MMAVAEAFDDEALLECKEFVPKLLEIHPDILVKVKLELSRMIDKQMFPSQFGLSTCQLFIKNMVLTRGNSDLLTKLFAWRNQFQIES